MSKKLIKENVLLVIQSQKHSDAIIEREPMHGTRDVVIVLLMEIFFDL